MNSLNKLGCMILLAAGVGTTQAAPVTLNFDTYLNGNALSDGTLLNDAYGGLGVTFNSTARVVLGGGGVTSQPNFATGGAGFATNLQLTFDNYGLSVGAANVTSSSWLLTAYDELFNVLGSVSSVNFPGISSLSSIGNIKYATFSTNSQYGIDDLTFDAMTNNVPEPMPLALVSLGLIAMTAIRKRKTADRNTK